MEFPCKNKRTHVFGGWRIYVLIEMTVGGEASVKSLTPVISLTASLI